jgi:DNA repair protein SbcC/Rad50
MRVTHVVARAFGPFRGARIDLAPGMTVIAGPNESGKSTWHAALRLALTGIKRGRGRATAVDAAVAAQHRPWDGSDEWEVEAGLVLDDGRTIELRQDLAGKVSCSALDIGLGRDVSDEILDGTPDASRWLGLDRETFAATLSVSQAQIMAVAEAAEGLQEQMQRAAATRGTDATAAEAIERLEAFRRDVVGADTAHAKGPLRLARLKLAAATEAREFARARHAEHLAERGRLERAATNVDEARVQLDVALAGRARREAIAAQRRAARALELSARLPERPTLASRDGRADLVAAAVTGWERRPLIPDLEGPSSEELEAELAALPEVPTGDIAPHPDVLAAAHELDMAEAALQLVSGERPLPTTAEKADGPGVRIRGREALPIGIPVVLIGVGLLLSWLGQPLPAVALAGLGMAGLAWAIGRTSGARATEEADRVRHADHVSRWRELEQRQAAAMGDLRAKLIARGAEVGGDAHAAWVAYQSACEERAGRAAISGRREALEARLAARRQAEGLLSASRRAGEEAERALREAADSVGIDQQELDPESMVMELRNWQQSMAAALEASRVAIEEWQELEGLLAEGTLEDLQHDADTATHLADQMEAALPAQTLPPEERRDLAGEIEERRRVLAAAEAQAAELRGSLESSARSLPDVAEAEEAAESAAAELARVESTARTIDETLRLLRRAQDQVHRNLAPILADAVRGRLPVVSGGAYSDVTVDPATLSIRVKESRSGIWREARLLSQGTREQIYLLLRVGMAQHLVTTSEAAPLVLDEVTAQADGERRAALLSILHALSAERQIILFSHDAEVAAWAERTLAGPQDRLIRLPSLTRPVTVDGPLVGVAVQDLPITEAAITG